MRTVKVGKSSKNRAYHEGLSVPGVGDFKFDAEVEVSEAKLRVLEERRESLEEQGYSIEVSGDAPAQAEPEADPTGPGSGGPKPEGAAKSRGR